MKAARDQGDINLAFDGAGGTGVNRSTGNKYAGNMAKQTMRENYGRGPTVAGVTGKTAGPAMAKPIGTRYNADSINFGCAPPCETRPFMPRAVKNYNGNPDMINEGRGPTKGNQK